MDRKPTKPGSTGRNAVLVGENALDRKSQVPAPRRGWQQWYAQGKLKLEMHLSRKAIILVTVCGGRIDETSILIGW